jgi:hypothetical protein
MDQRHHRPLQRSAVPTSCASASLYAETANHCPRAPQVSCVTATALERPTPASRSGSAPPHSRNTARLDTEQVWAHAQDVLAGTRGIGDQMARFAALANHLPAQLRPATARRTRPGPPRAPAGPQQPDPHGRRRENPAHHHGPRQTPLATTYARRPVPARTRPTAVLPLSRGLGGQPRARQRRR